MSRRQKNPLRTLEQDERLWLKRIARSTGGPASHVARAKQLLAAAEGLSYTTAAHVAGRKSGDAVAQLIARFNDEGLKAIEPRRGGGPKPTYAAAARGRILQQARRAPGPEQGGTASWSLMTLRRAPRQASDGLPAVSTYTVRAVLEEAGWSWPRTRAWCEAGISTRKRKGGERVRVIDPDAAAEKS